MPYVVTPENGPATVWADGETARADVSCATCVHRERGPGAPRCAAFPDGIPLPILDGEVSHLEPIEGDRGIRYDVDPDALIPF